MTWTLVLQVLVLTIVGGLTVSGAVSDVVKAHAKGRAAVATAIIEAQHKAHAEARTSMKVEGMFDGL